MDNEQILSKIDSLGTFAYGSHDPTRDGAVACAMEAVAWAAGEPWSDCPSCVPSDLAAFLRSLNDSAATDGQRWLEIRPRIPKILAASHDPDVAHRRGLLALDWLIRTYLPALLRLVPSLVEHAERLETLQEITDDNAEQAGVVVRSAMDAARAAARAAAMAAAGGAARAAAMDAARAAAGGAARAAAGGAAWGAAWDASWDASWDAAIAAAMDAARAAAMDAAMDALSATADTLRASAVALLDRMLEVE